MMSELQKKVNQRKAARIQTRAVMNKIEKQLIDESATQAKLLGLQNNLNSKIEQLNNLNDEVLNLLDSEDVEQDVLESMEFIDPTHELLAEVTLKLKSFVDSNNDERESVSSSRSVTTRCRLPKFELPIFRGDPLSWQGFWDQFNTAIHENEEISDIDRFNYLKRFLGGQALETISGLTLSSSNYREAISILMKRYGNPQVLISAHMESLIKMVKIKNKSDLNGLRKLYNSIENCVRNLSALGLNAEAYGSLLIPLLKDKLPDELNIVISRRFGSDIWTLDLLLKYFNDELTAFENCLSSISKPSNEEIKRKTHFTASNLYAQNENHKKGVCVFCDKVDHTHNQCQVVTEPETRKMLVKKKGRCYICLGVGHAAKNCLSNYRCRKCQGKHHISICTFGNSNVELTHTKYVSSSRGILLQTAKADISDTESLRALNVRILFDSGSQRSYVSEKVCDDLNLKPIRTERVVIKTFGHNETKLKKLKVVQLMVKHKVEGFFTFVEALCVPMVCSPLTNQNIREAREEYDHIRTIELADDNINGDLGIDILIGVDFYHSFFTGKIKRRAEGPVASETVLGWVLSGKLGKSSDPTQHCFKTHVLRTSVEKGDDCLKNALSKFWEVESVGTKECSVIHEFENEIYHNGERYVTKLPFKPDHDTLPDNFSVCEKRLESTKRRLVKGGILEDYNKVFVDYEREGIIERVPKDLIFKECGSVHYLPHRAVVREDKETTKIRAVFDASCAVNGPSLNDCLYSGPNLLVKIFDILIRFRLNKIAIQADIKQAFLNIEIDPKHQDYLRFLWHDLSSEELDLIVYKFLRVVFGVNSSPFLLNATIRQHLYLFLDKHLEFVKRFIEDLYVDDTTTGCNNVEQGKQFYQKAMHIMKLAGFTLRKWVSNSSQLQNYFDYEGKIETCDEQEIGDDISFAESEITGVGKVNNEKVLGLEWDKDTDEFIFCFSKFVEKCRSIEITTKRDILSMSASLYDPLGFISPITAQIKTIFQTLCEDKLNWDDPVSGKFKTEWMDLVKKLEVLKEIKVMRFAFCEQEQVISTEIHGFCDSSVKVYCAVVYVRVITTSGISVYFWSSKTKVAPMKQLSIPRLELLGCHLLSMLIKDIQVAICDRVKIDSVVCWTDSSVALCWIKGKEKEWKPWVENRVVRIRSVVPREQWFHVPGVLNPADAPTRVVENFVDFFNDQWFFGPSFLLDEQIRYDNCYCDVDVPDTLQERRTSHEVLNTCTVTVDNVNDNVGDLSNIIEFIRYSSWKKLVNVVAYVLRFMNNLLSSVRKTGELTEGVLTVEETNISRDAIILCEQRKISKQRHFGKLSASLNIFLDDRGFYRLRGRFAESELLIDQKYPKLIASDSYVTKLIIRDAHERVLHMGVESTLAKIRQQYWIVRGRSCVKSCLRKCFLCRRFQGRTMIPAKSPDLPDFRVNHMAYAFEATGLDYCGPLFIKNCNASSKAYILLLTCASSRALHLELVPDMKSEAFIRAFKRFMARRGKPNMIINDNFRTFRSANVKSFMLKEGVTQKYILPASPWWGGFYERMVRSVKTTLKKILRKSMLMFEELQTVLCEVESVLNHRPLCYSSDDDIGETLTPNHLMHGRVFTNAISSGQVVFNSVDECQRRVKYVQTVHQQFWKRFSQTYLAELRQHHSYRNSKTSNPVLKEGDVVLVRDDVPQPRTQWKMAKVEKLITGSDGNLRGAKLKVNSESGRSVFVHRPVQKLIPFEITDVDAGPVYDLAPEKMEDETTHIVEKPVYADLSGARDESHKEGRIRRRAAIEGQSMRRLRSKYC